MANHGYDFVNTGAPIDIKQKIFHSIMKYFFMYIFFPVLNTSLVALRNTKLAFMQLVELLRHRRIIARKFFNRQIVGFLVGEPKIILGR